LADLREELVEELSAVRREFDGLFAPPAAAAAVDLGVCLQPDASCELSEFATRLAQLEVRAISSNDILL
jgi:hypothetical protein